VRGALARALARADLVLLVGRHLEGRGDLSQRVVSELDRAWSSTAVALKPGKPICLRSGTPGRRRAAGLPDLAVFSFTSSSRP